VTSTAEAFPFSVATRTRFVSNLLQWAGLLALVGTVLRSVPALIAAAHRPWLLNDYNASNWWLDYGIAGFVRRALPGQVLTWLVGGPPSAWQVTGASLTIAGAAVVATAWLAWTLARRAEPHVRLPVAALVVASPLAVGQVIRDIGRYDAIGISAVALMVATAKYRRAAPVIAGIALLVAGLSEEFLVAYAAPVAAIVAARGRSGWHRIGVPAAAVGPGVVVTAVSSLMPVTVHDLANAEAAAHAARPDVLPGHQTAIASLWQTPGEALGHLADMHWWVVPLSIAVYGGCFAVTGALLWYLVGRPARFDLYALGFAVVTVALSLTATDYQRWWSVAFVSAVAVLALLVDGRAAERPSDRPAVDVPVWCAVVLAAVLLVSVAGQLGPVGAGHFQEGTDIGISLPPSQ
jgi:hypothetical protein